MTRKILLIITLLAIVCAKSFSQDNGQAQQSQPTWDQCKSRFKCEKVAYITSEMKFTVEEAQKFWPLYNQYDAIFDSIGATRRCCRQLHRTDCRAAKNSAPPPL